MSDQRRPPMRQTPSCAESNPEVERAAEALLQEPDLLGRAMDATAQLGHVGEEINRRMVLLAAVAGQTARTHEDAIHLVLKGESSSGKNALVGRVLSLFPESSVTTLTGISKQALIYLPDKELSGVVVFQEVEAQKGAEYMIRQAMSEGSLRRMTVVGKPGVGNETEEVETYVRASLITTTTEAALHPENETRLFVLETDDSEELTERVLKQAARRAAGHVASEEERNRIRRTWRRALDKLEPAQVVIPFARQIAEAFPSEPVRARRDVPRTFNLIRTCTLLHQWSRDRDGEGRLVASPDDYALVYPLVQRVLGASMSGLTDKAIAIDKLLQDLARTSDNWAGFRSQQRQRLVNKGSYIDLARKLATDSPQWVSRQKLVQEADERDTASHNTVDKWAKRFVARAVWDRSRLRGEVFYMPRRDAEGEPLPLPLPEDLGSTISPHRGVGREDARFDAAGGDDPSHSTEVAGTGTEGDTATDGSENDESDNLEGGLGDLDWDSADSSDLSGEDGSHPGVGEGEGQPTRSRYPWDAGPHQIDR